MKNKAVKKIVNTVRKGALALVIDAVQSAAIAEESLVQSMVAIDTHNFMSGVSASYYDELLLANREADGREVRQFKGIVEKVRADLDFDIDDVFQLIR